MTDTIIAGGHNPANDFDGALTELEARADLSSLEGLHAARRSLIAQNAGMIARYGNFGMHDDFRKQMLEAQKVKVRMELSAGKDKAPAQGVIDAEAYGSAEYQAFLDRSLSEKIQYLTIQNEIDTITEQIRGRELALVAYSAECKLGR